MPTRAAAALVALLGLCGASAPRSAEPLTLETLMRGMAGASGVVAEFEEVKELALLAAPIRSRGRLYFVPPDRMVRHTTEPAESRLIVDGERMEYLDGSEAEPVDLSADPAAREFAENFVALFAGDLEALRARYEVAFHSEPPRWTLELKPRSARVRRFVAGLSLRGEDQVLREIVLVEADGDRTTTRLETVDAEHRYSAGELLELFGTGPR